MVFHIYQPKLCDRLIYIVPQPSYLYNLRTNLLLGLYFPCGRFKNMACYFDSNREGSSIMSEAPKSRLAQVTGRDVVIDPTVHYEGWADSYNKELIENYGYCAHEIAVQHFTSEFISTELPIIDIGCGTGLVRQELAKTGYQVIDGVDISEKMLAYAEKLGSTGT
jgi:SAM-dependent methyltransferase